jgi:hypothetical protein
MTPARRGKGNMRQESIKTDACVPASRHAAMTCTRGHKGTTPETSIQYRHIDL